MFRSTTAALAACALLSGCASAPRPPERAAPLAIPEWPLASCQRGAWASDDSIALWPWHCGEAVVMVYALEPTPPSDNQLVSELLRQGYIRQAPVRLDLPGGAVEALRLSKREAASGEEWTAYVAERRSEEELVRVVSCTSREGAGGRARCEQLMDGFLADGVPARQEPAEFTARKLEVLLGRKVALPGDCVLESGHGARGGALRCKERLELVWEDRAEPPERTVAALHMALDEAGDVTASEALTCLLRGRRTPCVRVTGEPPWAGYVGVLPEQPALLVACRASDTAAELRALCDELFQPEPPASSTR